MDSSGGSQQDSNLYFSAELQDNVSPTADQIEQRLKRLGASRHEIKIFMQAYDQASQKIQQAQEHLKKLPKQHIINIQANTSQIDQAHKRLEGLRAAAKAPITLVMKVGDNIDEHFRSFKQKIPQMETELKGALRNMPLTAGLLNATSSAYGLVSGPISTMTGLPFSSLGAGGAALGVGGASAAFFAKSFQQNVALEQQMAQLNQIMRSPAAAQTSYNQVVQTSLTTPFNMPDVLKSYIQMAQMGTNPKNPAFGVKSAANLAAGSQVPISQATGALQNASLGYFEQLNTLTGRNIRQTDFTYGGRYSGQTYQQATLGVLKQYQNASEVQMHTFKGLMTNIQDVITQKLVIPAGAPLFGAAKGLEQQSAAKLQSPAFQLQMSREVDKLQVSLVKVFQLVEQGSTYFKNSLEQPLKQITSAAVSLGSVFGKTFGGAVITGVKYLGEALTTILTPLASVAKQMPIIGQVAGLFKALHVFGISTNTGIGDMAKGLGTLNPFRIIQGFKELSSTIAKIGFYEVVKSFLDMKNANDQLDAAFKGFGHSGKETVDMLKVGFDGLIIRANQLGKSVAQLKSYGAVAAEGVGPNVGIDKLTQVARFGSLDIAKLSMNLGMGGMDTAQVFKTWEKAMNATGAIQGGKTPRHEMDMIYTNVYQAAEKLSKVLGISLNDAAKAATVSLNLFKKELTQTGIVSPRGASAVSSIFTMLQRPGGMTAADEKKFGSPSGLMRQLLQNAVAPSVEVLQHAIKQPGGLRSSFDFYSNYPMLRRSFLHHTEGGALYPIAGATKDIQDTLRAYENVPRSSAQFNTQMQKQFGWASNLGGQGHIQLPQFQNVLPQLGVNLKSAQIPDMTTKQTAQAMIQVNKALENQVNVLQKVNAEVTRYQEQLSALQLVGEQASAAMAKFNLSVESQQRAIDRWQLSLSQSQLGLNALERGVAALGQQMTDYEHNKVLPVQRAQEDWNQSMLLTSNRLEDVSFKMQVAQFNMDKFNSGMLTGENALTAQIEKLTIYNSKLDELRLLNMGLQADITKTQFHQGFTATVKPLVGFDLSREIQLGQERQQLMQDHYNTTYGYQHWKLQRAARPLFQRQEMSFAARMSGTTQARGTLDKGMLQTMAIQIQQYHEQLHSRKLEQRMYDLTVGARSLQDKQYEKQKEAFVLQQNISKRSDQIAQAQLSIQKGQLPLQEAITHIQNKSAAISYSIDKKLIPLTEKQGQLQTAVADLHTIFGELSGQFDKNIKGGEDSVLGNLRNIAKNMQTSVIAQWAIYHALGGHGKTTPAVGPPSPGSPGGSHHANVYVPPNFNTSREAHPHSSPGFFQGAFNTATGLLNPLNALQTFQDLGHNVAGGLGLPGVVGTGLGIGAFGLGGLEALNLARFGVDQLQGRVIGPGLTKRSATLRARVANREVASIGRDLGLSKSEIRDLGFKTALPGRGIVGGFLGEQLKENLKGAPALAPATYVDKAGETHDASMFRRVARSPLLHATNFLRAGGAERLAFWGSLPLTHALGPAGPLASAGFSTLAGREAGAVPYEPFKTTRNWWNYMKKSGPLGKLLSPIGFPLHGAGQMASTIGHTMAQRLGVASDTASAVRTAAHTGPFTGFGDILKEAWKEQGLSNKVDKLGTLSKPFFAALVDAKKAGAGGNAANIGKDIAEAQAGSSSSRGGSTTTSADKEAKAVAEQTAQTANKNAETAAKDARTSDTNTRSAKSVSESARNNTATAKTNVENARVQRDAAARNRAASQETRRAAHETRKTAEQLRTTQDEHLKRESGIIEREGSHIRNLGGSVRRFGGHILHFGGRVLRFGGIISIMSSLISSNFKHAIEHFASSIADHFVKGVSSFASVIKDNFTKAVDHLGGYIHDFGKAVGGLVKDLAKLLHIHIPHGVSTAVHAAGSSRVGQGITHVLSRAASSVHGEGPLSTALKVGGKAVGIASKVVGAAAFIPALQEAFGNHWEAAARSAVNAATYFVPGLGEIRITADIIKALNAAGILTSGRNTGGTGPYGGPESIAKGSGHGATGTGVYTPPGGTPTYIRKGAAGGLVSGTTLAILGESGPEVVIPVDKLKQIASSAHALPSLGQSGIKHSMLDDKPFLENVKNNPIVTRATQDLTDYLDKRYKQHFNARTNERQLHQTFDSYQLKDKLGYYKQSLNDQNQSQTDAVSGQHGLKQYLTQLGTFITSHWTKRLKYVNKGYQQEVMAHNAGYQAITSTTSSWLTAIDDQIKKWAKSWKVPVSQAANSSGGATQGSMTSPAGVGGPGNLQGFAHGGLVHADKHKVGPGRMVRMVEEGHAEVVIPLAPHRRDRARSLVNQTRGMLGMAAGGYVNPIPGFNISQVDMGIDASGPVGAPILAIGDSKLVYVNPSWYSGQPLLDYQFQNGPLKDRYWYVAEQIAPVTERIGAMFKAGQAVGHFAASGTGIEIGFAGNASGSTLTQTTAPGQVATRHSGAGTTAGNQFLAFIKGLAQGKLVVGGPAGGGGVSNTPPIHLKDVPNILKQMGAVGGIHFKLLEHIKKKAEDHLNQQGASAGGGGLGPGMSLSGPVEKQVYEYMSKAGFNKVAIAGMLGNALQESTMNPNTPGGGLWQQISNFGPSSGGSLLHQMQVMLPQILGFKGILNSAPSPEMAALAFSNLFEKDAGTVPGGGPYSPNTATSANMPRREAGARAAFAAGYSGGLPRVPHDGYPAILHKDEQVLSAGEAEFRRKARSPHTKDLKLALDVFRTGIEKSWKEIMHLREDIKHHASHSVIHKDLQELHLTLKDMKKDGHQMLLNQISAEIKATGPKAAHLDKLLGHRLTGGKGGPFGSASYQGGDLMNTLIGQLHNIYNSHTKSYHSLEDEIVKLRTYKATLKTDSTADNKQLDKIHKELKTATGTHKKQLETQKKHLEHVLHKDHQNVNKLEKAIHADEMKFIKQGMAHGISRQLLTGAIRNVGIYDNQSITTDQLLQSMPSALASYDKTHKVGRYYPPSTQKLNKSSGHGGGTHPHHHHKHPHYDKGGPVRHDALAMVHAGEHVVPREGALVIRQGQRAGASAHYDPYTKKTAEHVQKTNELLHSTNDIWNKFLVMSQNAAIKGAPHYNRLGTLQGGISHYHGGIGRGTGLFTPPTSGTTATTTAAQTKQFNTLAKEINKDIDKMIKEYKSESKRLETWHKKVEAEWKHSKQHLDKVFHERMKQAEQHHKAMEKEYKERRKHLEKLFKDHQKYLETHFKGHSKELKEHMKELEKWHKEHMKTLQTWHKNSEKHWETQKKDIETWHKEHMKKLDDWHNKTEKEYDTKRKELNHWHEEIHKLHKEEENVNEKYHDAVKNHHGKQAAHYLKVEEHLKKMADKIERLNPNVMNNINVNVSGTTATVRTATSPTQNR